MNYHPRKPRDNFGYTEIYVRNEESARISSIDLPEKTAKFELENHGTFETGYSYFSDNAMEAFKSFDRKLKMVL
ncbi:hypothetical protein B0186_01980 [Canicola haemoglobinophilus]|uniref:hypothetical protein n=1 Tax=Canicola haemoglobinophilus TaxID=733 RepID=UPI0009922158|nr:hypothetical protein [Canicola haemoglobinophilus]OOS01840.1 hypothetical protein B0186_01980 [Canicola haemoglobinophilus]